MQEYYKNLSLENINREEWKDIVGYEGLYMVSNYGRVKSLNYNHTKKPGIINQRKTKDGYLLVNIYKDGKGKTHKVHRLVAETFIPNPYNKPTVDHINTIKTDNRVSNLRWFTQKEQVNENEITNERHKKAISIIGKRTIKEVLDKHKKKVICITTNIVFNSIKEAADYYNIKSISNIIASCSGNVKCAGKNENGVKLEWRYLDDNNEIINPEISYSGHCTRKVICVTTGIIFNSIKEAAEYYKINDKIGISACCRKKQKSCGKLPDGTKLVWEYVEEKE